MAELWSNGEWAIDSTPYGGRQGLPPPVMANDPRTPPPAPDLQVWAEPGLPALVLPSGSGVSPTLNTEEEVSKKIGIFATRGDEFAVSVLDDDNDPVDGGSFKFGATEIIQKVKPLLEAAGHKVVDQTFGSLHEAASDGKVRTMPRRKAASDA